jgi:hypothetical protein
VVGDCVPLLLRETLFQASNHLERFNGDGRNGEDRILRVLKLAPFKRATWRLADSLPEDLRAKYWTEANPSWTPEDGAEACELVDGLLSSGGPRRRSLRCGSLDSPLIVRLLKDSRARAQPPPRVSAQKRRSGGELNVIELLDADAVLQRRPFGTECNFFLPSSMTVRSW